MLALFGDCPNATAAVAIDWAGFQWDDWCIVEFVALADQRLELFARVGVWSNYNVPRVFPLRQVNTTLRVMGALRNAIGADYQPTHLLPIKTVFKILLPYPAPVPAFEGPFGQKFRCDFQSAIRMIYQIGGYGKQVDLHTTHFHINVVFSFSGKRPHELVVPFLVDTDALRDAAYLHLPTRGSA